MTAAIRIVDLECPERKEKTLASKNICENHRRTDFNGLNFVYWHDDGMEEKPGLQFEPVFF